MVDAECADTGSMPPTVPEPVPQRAQLGIGRVLRGTLATTGAVHALIGGVVAVAMTAIMLKDNCYFRFGSNDLDKFRASGDVCDAPLWVTGATTSFGGWAVQLGLCNVLAVLVHHRYFYLFMAALGGAYAAGMTVMALVIVGFEFDFVYYALAPLVMAVLAWVQTVVAAYAFTQHPPPTPDDDTTAAAPTDPLLRSEDADA